MARYTRYRKYSRRLRKKTWSSRIHNLDVQQQVAQNQNFFYYKNLALNPTQSDDSISQKFTVKNIRIQFSMESTATDNHLENCQAFIIFIPQGFTPSAATPYDHPEWIMASKHIGVPLSPDNPGYSPLFIGTRLARKLDTGDRICFILQGANPYSSVASARLTGIIRYNTKAN